MRRFYNYIIKQLTTLRKCREYEQDKATADFVRAHTLKYTTEQKRKVNEVLQSIYAILNSEKFFEFSLVYLCAYNAQSARISRRTLADIYSVGDIVEV